MDSGAWWATVLVQLARVGHDLAIKQQILLKISFTIPLILFFFPPADSFIIELKIL